MNAKTLLYILKRVLLAIFTYFLVVTVTFWIMQMVPGGPWNSEKALSEETIAALNEMYGLDGSLFEQYLRYLGRAACFNFGPSLKLTGKYVTNIILSAFPTSAAIGAIAAFLALIVGVLLGTYAATHQNKTFDRVIMVLTTGFVAMPTFVIALILLYLFSVNLHWVPANVIDASTGDLRGYILPIITEALYPTAYITRLMRSSTLDVLGQDYMRTAKAKGLTPSRILIKHGIRNSITPVITYFGPMFASIITGSLVVEQIYSVPGIGQYFYTSITNRDYPLIMGTTCFLSLLLIVFTLLSDLAYKVANPRVDFD